MCVESHDGPITPYLASGVRPTSTIVSYRVIGEGSMPPPPVRGSCDMTLSWGTGGLMSFRETCRWAIKNSMVPWLV